MSSVQQDKKRWRWVVLLACYISIAMSTPVIYSFGIFVLPWKRAFSASGAAISLVTSCGSAISGAAGPIASLLIQKWGYRVTHALGGFLMATGYGAASFATSLVHLFVAYSVISGIGVAFCTTSYLNAVSEHFHDHQGIAFAFVTSAYGVGGIVFPVIFQSLIEKYDWRGAMLICSGIQANVIVCGLLTYQVSATPPWPRILCYGAKADKRSAMDDGNDREGECVENNSVRNRPCEVAADLTEREPLEEHGKLGMNQELNCDVIFLEEKNSAKAETDFDFEAEVKPPFKVVAKSLLSCWSFYIVAIHNITGFIGFMIFMGLTPIRASYDLNFTDHQVTFLMSTFGVAQLIFRLSFGALAELKVAKPATFFFLFHFVGGISSLLSVLAKTFVWQVVYCTVASSYIGCLSFYPVVLYQIFERRLFNAAAGFLSIMLGIGTVSGPLLGGYMFDVTGTSQYSFVFAGISTLFSVSTLLIGSYFTKEIKRLRLYVL